MPRPTNIHLNPACSYHPTRTEDELDEEDEDEDMRDLIEEDEDEDEGGCHGCLTLMNECSYIRAHTHSYPMRTPTIRPTNKSPDFSDFEDEEEDGFSDEEDLGKSEVRFGLNTCSGRGFMPPHRATSKVYRRQKY